MATTEQHKDRVHPIFSNDRSRSRHSPRHPFQHAGSCCEYSHSPPAVQPVRGTNTVPPSGAELPYGSPVLYGNTPRCWGKARAFTKTCHEDLAGPTSPLRHGWPLPGHQLLPMSGNTGRIPSAPAAGHAGAQLLGKVQRCLRSPAPRRPPVWKRSRREEPDHGHRS